MTLDARVKALAKQLAEIEGTDLSGLTNSLLVERLKEAGMWAPTKPGSEHQSVRMKNDGRSKSSVARQEKKAQ
jgi:hypothetical protein